MKSSHKPGRRAALLDANVLSRLARVHQTEVLLPARISTYFMPASIVFTDYSLHCPDFFLRFLFGLRSQAWLHAPAQQNLTHAFPGDPGPRRRLGQRDLLGTIAVDRNFQAQLGLFRQQGADRILDDGTFIFIQPRRHKILGLPEGPM